MTLQFPAPPHTVGDEHAGFRWDGEMWVPMGDGGPAITLPLPIADGGTNATTAGAARTNLGVNTVPIAFVIPGDPESNPTGWVVTAPIALTLPVNLTGSRGFSATNSGGTAPVGIPFQMTGGRNRQAVFTLTKIGPWPAFTQTALGQISTTSVDAVTGYAGNRWVPMGAGGSIDAGDTLWLTYSYNAFPATADPEENPADVTITFLAERA